MTTGIESLIKKYGGKVSKTPTGRIPSELKDIKKTQLFTRNEAYQMGYMLDPGWRIKITPVEGRTPTLSFITPDDWEITQDQMYISPQGERFTAEQLRQAMVEQEMAEEGFVGGVVWGDIEPPKLPAAELEPEISPYALTEQFGIPPMIETPELEGMWQWAAEDIDDFWEAIREVGPSQATTDILKTLFPDITDAEISEIVPEIPELLPGMTVTTEGLEMLITLDDEEGNPVEKVALMKPDKSVWVDGKHVGNFNVDTGLIDPQIEWWQWPLIGLEWAFAPFALLGQAMISPTEAEEIKEREKELVGEDVLAQMDELRARIADVDTPVAERFELTSQLMTLEKERARKVGKAALPGGEAYREYREKPFWLQILAELPAWIAAAGVTVRGIRAGLRVPAAKPGIPGVVPRVVRGALLPAELAERVPALAIKYGIVVPVTKAVPAVNAKLLQTALAARIDKWIAFQARRYPEGAEPFWAKWMVDNKFKVVEKATNHIKRRMAEGKGASAAATSAADDTVRELEPLLLKAADDAGIKIKPTKAVVPRPEVVPPKVPVVPKAVVPPKEVPVVPEVKPPVVEEVVPAKVPIVKPKEALKPVPPAAEQTALQIRTNLETPGSPTLTPAQVSKTLDLFGKYVTDPSTEGAWGLTRELRKEALSHKAESLKARAEELIISQGVDAEEAMRQAIRETMSGELPVARTDYLDDLTDKMRDALFNKVYQTLKDEPFEMASTVTALTNALLGKPIPREPGIRGGSAYTRLERVFSEQPAVFEAIKEGAREGKSLKGIVEGLYHEVGRPPMQVDQLTADYLRAISKKVKTAEDVLAIEAYAKAHPKAPIPPYEPPINKAIKQVPMWPTPGRDTIIKVLKEIGWSPIDIGNFLRANKASFDMSFWRQQGPLILNHPTSFFQANVDAWKALWSQKGAEASWEIITRDPLYQLYEIAEAAGFDFLRPLTLAKGTSQWRGVEEFGYLTGERLIPRLTQKIPWVKLSARAFVTGTNSHNWRIFKNHYEAMLKVGEKVASGEKQLKPGEAFSIQKEMSDMAKLLADFTQRASLGKAAGLAPAFNALIFAPRATLGKLLTPRHLVSANPYIRKEAWRNLFTFIAGVGGIVLLGEQLGLWDVEKDPRSAEFMSVRIGNVRIDPWSGYRQYLVFTARVITDTGLSSVTGAEYQSDPIRTMTSFVRGKSSPLASVLLDFWTGRTFVGEEVDVANPKQWIERIAPFALWDIFEAYMDDPAMGAWVALPAIVGAGVQTYTGDWKENWKKLGLPKYSDNLMYGQTEPYYDAADFWADTLGKLPGAFKGVDPETLTEEKGFPPYIKAIVEAKVIKDHLNTLPNERLVSLNADQAEGTTFADYYKMWKDREEIVASGDEDKLKEFDADERTSSAHLGNFSQKQFALLNQYWAITDPDKQVEFLEENKELIGTNLRQGYLKEHPKENAQLAVWGQAKLLSMEAYTEFKKLMDKLDMPINAIPEQTLPPEDSAEGYFEYLDVIEQPGRAWNSWEAQIIYAQDDELRKFLEFDPVETPLRALELKIKHRELSDQYDALETDEERAKLKADNPEWVDDKRRIEAIEHGAEGVTIPTISIEEAVSHINWAKEGHPAVDEWNRKWLQNYDFILGVLDDIESRKIEANQINKAIAILREDIKLDEPPEGWDAWIEKELKAGRISQEDIDSGKVKFIHKEMVEGYRQIVSLLESNLPDAEKNIVEAWVERGRLIDEHNAGSSEVLIWGLDYPGAYKWAVDQKLLKDNMDELLEREESLRINIKYRSEDEQYYTTIPEKYEVMTDEVINSTQPPKGVNIKYWIRKTANEKRDVLIGIARENYLARNEGYRRDMRRKEAHEKKFPDNEIEMYVDYYEIPAEGYRRERYLIENGGEDHENPTGFALSMHELQGIDLDDPKTIPAVGYDEVSEEWEEEFDKWDNLGNHESSHYEENVNDRVKERDKMKYEYTTMAYLKHPEMTDFGKAIYRRDAYESFIPEEHIDTFVEWYTSTKLLKPINWKQRTKTERWYEDDWFLMEHPEFLQTMLELEIWVGDYDFSKVPSRKVFGLYREWLWEDLGKPRRQFEANHPDLDLWLHIVFGTQLESERVGGARPTTVREEVKEPIIPWEQIERQVQEGIQKYR